MVQELAGLAEADTPRAGMFLWLKLLTVPDSGALRAAFKREKVVVVPGEDRSLLRLLLLTRPPSAT